ncbi:DUF4229 domain-containing protein [Streptomyces sp. NPDC012623]|uniref:DUF4229 domain-containing protein n=1 Tax=unclassified Streptomyces TaxID=2593676 RepID=UPI003699DBDD
MTAAKTNATIRYTAMRFGVFVLCFAFVALLVQLGVLPKGLGDSNFLWVPLLAIILSAPVSFVLLRKQRDAMSVQLAPRIDHARARLETNRAQEDGAVQ